MARTYDELIGMVSEIEKTATKVEFNAIDISGISQTEVVHPKPEFNRLLGLAMAIESGHVQEPAPRQRAAVQQVQAPAATQQAAAAATTAQTATVASASSSPRMVQWQIPRGSKPQPQETVKSEVSAFASNLDQKKEQPQQPINTFNIKVSDEDDDLVLPQLSVSDQISELERIIEGLHEHVFDGYHIEIVRKEISGLNRKIAREKKQIAAGAQPSSIEQSFMDLRDKRLAEVIAALGESK